MVKIDGDDREGHTDATLNQCWFNLSPQYMGMHSLASINQHLLQPSNCYRNSRLVVGADDLKWFKH